MELQNYLAAQGLSAAEFGQRIGASRVAVSRYTRKLRVPRGDIMRRIAAATDNQVTPNDFHGVAAPDAA
jgi:transcriptional regulator with XRE-family HTH domain